LFSQKEQEIIPCLGACSLAFKARKLGLFILYLLQF
jgi:hypothetical protein